jgi:glycosyltransferase involved in cell wall biosynthesis
MRALFLVSGGAWNASARAFVLAANGLSRRNHEVAIACESDCPIHVHAQTADLPIVPLRTGATGTGGGWRLRDAVRDGEVDVVFVHTDAEQYVASSAVRFARRNARIIRRIPPFATVTRSRRAAFASRLAPAGLLFATEADRDAAAHSPGFRLPAAVAPLAVEPASYDAIPPTDRGTFDVAAGGRLIVCIQDGKHPQRVLTAIRALSLLAPRHPELRMVIVGSGDLDELRMHGAAVGVNALITYMGVRDDELSIIKSADVGWIAAESDAAAFAALDCMAAGVPVIAERNRLTELYVADGIGGILLSSTDATDTAALVASFFAKGDQRAQMGAAARSRLQREFPFDAMLDGYEEAMQGAAASAGAAD